MMSLYDLMVGNSMTAQKADLGKAKPNIKMMANFGTKLPLAGALTFGQMVLQLKFSFVENLDRAQQGVRGLAESSWLC